MFSRKKKTCRELFELGKNGARNLKAYEFLKSSTAFKTLLRFSRKYMKISNLIKLLKLAIK